MSQGPGELEGLRVLVVEDSFLVADTICGVLSECGCEVISPAPNLDISVMPEEFRTVHRILKRFDFNDLVAIIARSFGGRPAHRSIPRVYLRSPSVCPLYGRAWPGQASVLMLDGVAGEDEGHNDRRLQDHTEGPVGGR